MSSSSRTVESCDTSHPAAQRAPRRREWRRAWRALRILAVDPERTEQVFELLDALEGPLGERSFRDFAADPRGQQQLSARPDLLAHLRDREALRALPEGSLGRAYLAFMEEGDLVADELVNAEDEAGTTGPPLDADRRWVADRGRDSHDLWHVLTGYGRDEAGEVALLAFTYASYPNLGILMILLVAALIGPKTRNFRFERYLREAWRRGRATDLDFAPYEEWLALPLDEVRRRARLPTPQEAHPMSGIVAANRDPDTVIAFGMRPS